MAGRERTTKKLAQRIDRDYFKRTFAIARWRNLLSLGCIAIALGWLAWHAFARDQRVYTAGKLTAAHAILDHHCESCHQSGSAFTMKVTNQACTSCHDGPVHQARQMFEPACVTCHEEHQSPERLRLASDSACTTCHADLRVKTGTVKVAAHIDSFNSGHPEFAVLRKRQPDPGTIRFSHAVHMKNGLRGTQSNVQLQCTSCHRTMRTGDMTPVNFERDCEVCHALNFSDRVSEPAPHRAPDVVHAFIVQKLQQYIDAHPEELRRTSGAQIARVPPGPLSTGAAWVRARTQDAEQLLWNVRCAECHRVTQPQAGTLPVIAKASVPERWMPQARFRHAAHEMLACNSCHENALKSDQSSDVLLPGIALCQQCHGASERAGTGCNECHVYHDWSKEKPREGHLTLSTLSRSSR